MIDFTNTLLPNLPENLTWVYGVFYLLEGIFFFALLLSPLYALFGIIRPRRKR